MESIFRYIIYLLIVLTAVSCNVSEIETELDIPYKGDFLVLHGFICQDEGVRLFLQKTVPHSCATCSDSVSNAVVSLYENETYLFDLNTDDGYWYHSPSSFSPSIGNEYYIKAEAYKIPTAVTSSVSLMQMVSIDTAYIEATENRYRKKIRYRFSDIPNEQNYYMVQVISGNGNEDRFMWDKFSVFNKVIGDEVANNGIIEGETIHFVGDDDHDVELILYHLSPQLVQYIFSREENFFSEDDPFSEYPVPVFNNINKGYGFFGSYASSVYTIRF